MTDQLISVKETMYSQGAEEHEGERHATNESRRSTEVYYLSNFKAVLENCLLSSNPERHVISADEASTVDRFTQLSSPCQQLYVRLFLRKHLWHRASKLTYKDIAHDLNPLLQNLCKEGFLVNEAGLQDPSAVLDLLRVHELKYLCHQFHMPSSLASSSKAKVIEAFFKQDRHHQPLFGKKQFMSSVVTKSKVILGGCVKLSEGSADVFSKMLLLFSLTNSWTNRDEVDFSQIIFQMLQINIGRLLYTSYEIFTTQPLFKDKDTFEKYYQAVKDEQLLLSDAVESSQQNIVDMILQRTRKRLDEALGYDISSLPSFLLPFTCGHVYVRTLSHGAELLEKRAEYAQANQILEHLLSQAIYGKGTRKKWWDRLALNFHYHLKDKEKCLGVIHEALEDDSLTPPIRLSLVQRARRILQQKTSKSRKRKRSADNGGKDNKSTSSDLQNRCGPDLMAKFSLENFPEVDIIHAPEITITGKQLHTKLRPLYVTKINPEGAESSSVSAEALIGVESFAIAHYMKESEEKWLCALHAENFTFSMLFALLMWDIIFLRVPDVFRALFQSAPLDLFSQHFYASRKEKIDSRLHWIRTTDEEELTKAIEDSWAANFGCMCVGVNWELFPSAVDDAKDIALCLGQEILGHLCELFSKNYRSVCSGFPDLILWNPSSRTYKLVEVKGPGDKLSNKQLVWMTRLAQWNCPVELCHVTAKS